MGLDFGDYNAFGGHDAYFESILDKIKKVQDRLESKDKAIEELKYERDLIFGDLCNIISNDLKNSIFNIFRGFDSDICWKAWRWCNYKDRVDEELINGKLTKDEYDKYRVCFDLTVGRIIGCFFGELKGKVKFKEIIKNWTVGYDYIYTYKDQEVNILIPVFHADDKDYGYALEGYIAGYKESECVQGYIAHGLDYKEVAKKLQDWLINEKWKEKK